MRPPETLAFIKSEHVAGARKVADVGGQDSSGILLNIQRVEFVVVETGLKLEAAGPSFPAQTRSGAIRGDKPK